MKLCFPVQTKELGQATIHDHFDSATHFVLYDTEMDHYTSVANDNQHHQHGQCHPLKALQQEKIGAIICRGMGKRALQKVEKSGATVYRTDELMVHEAVEAFSGDRLEKIDLHNACGRHHCH